MSKLIKLDPNKVLYDGTSFVVVMSQTELLAKFKKLKLSMSTKPSKRGGK